MFKLAMLQLYVKPGGPVAHNLDHAAEQIARAAGQGADLVLLPEACDLGWTHPAARIAATPIPDGAACQRLGDVAVVHGVYLCAGIIEQAGDTVYNAAVIINPAGDVILHHRKLNELDIAHDLYAQGDQLGVIHTELGTLGLMICADANAAGHVITRSLGYMGADVILSPCSWAVPPEHDNAIVPYGQEWFDAYRPVARAFEMSIIGVSNVGPVTTGPWQDWRCIGCSLAIGPDGATLAHGPYGVDAETIMLIDVEPVPRPTRGTGWPAHQAKS